LRIRSVLAALTLALVAAASSASPPKPSPSPRLFALATLPRIRLETTRDHVVVVLDANVPRGDWQGGDVLLYVAFGAPGAPRAMDARLYAAPEGAKDPPADAPSEPIVLDRATRRPSNVPLLLGSSSMAGVVLKVTEASFRRAVGPSGVARIRLRALHDLPEKDARSSREVIVRLGTRGGEPLALGRIEVASLEATPWLTRADARLCGPEADPYPLAVSVLPKMLRPIEWPLPASPVLSVRHATDDLCIRFWTL
jgi:hypothetical protein